MKTYNLYQVKAQTFNKKYPLVSEGVRQEIRPTFVDEQYICAIPESDGELSITRLVVALREKHPNSHFSHCKLGSIDLHDENIADIVSTEESLNVNSNKSSFKVLRL